MTFDDILAQGRELLQREVRVSYGALNIQLATSHAIACAAKAVDFVHAAADTSAIRNKYKFQQYCRDVHTITQHAFAPASRYESVGAQKLGVESD